MIVSKSIPVLLFVLFTFTSAVCAAEREVLPPTAALAYTGEKATIEFEVQAATLLKDRDDPICFLNSLKNFRSEKTFTVVIFSEGLERFQQAKVADPAEHFRGKTIRVTGVIALRQGKPQIVVEYVGQIELVKKKESTQDESSN